jgi:nitrous oxidase accessory protein NosD
MFLMHFRPSFILTCVALSAALSQAVSAETLCVNPSGLHGCYRSIQAAVSHARAHDVINVAAGTYAEEVTIEVPLALIGEDAAKSTIDATNLPHGIFVDGFDHRGLADVVISGFTVENAEYEGILVVDATDVTIRRNRVLDNDKSPGLHFTGGTTGCPGQPGNGVYENDETGDCGGAVHLIGTTSSILDGNYISGNADGVLISDETAESRDNLLIHNTVINNPLECGIVLASHPPHRLEPAALRAPSRRRPQHRGRKPLRR